MRTNVTGSPPPARRARRDRRQQGQGLVEYSLILLFIAIACFSAVTLFGTAVLDLYQFLVDNLPF